MLNPENKLIYDILRSITGDDDIYKIVEAEEVLSKLPSEVSLSKVQLSAIIKDLKDRDYINVKYFTPDEYCLLTLKKSDEENPTVVEANKEVKEDNDKEKKERILYGKTEGQSIKSVKPGAIFFMAFLGAILGSGIVAAMVVILMKTVF